MSQRWEYCSVCHHGNTIVVDFLSPSDIANSKSATARHFNRFIAHLGKMGWELIAVIAGGTYFFERAIQPGRRIDDAF
jgi:hypothetical protein